MPVVAQAEHEPELPLAIGALAIDTSNDSVGRVMEISGALVFLRPMSGGLEWHVALDRVRVLTERQALSAKVADANARSESRVGVDHLFPLPLPAPHPGCDECARLDTQRRTARAAHDGSAETDARVLLRHHVAYAHRKETKRAKLNALLAAADAEMGLDGTG